MPDGHRPVTEQTVPKRTTRAQRIARGLTPRWKARQQVRRDRMIRSTKHAARTPRPKTNETPVPVGPIAWQADPARRPMAPYGRAWWSR